MVLPRVSTTVAVTVLPLPEVTLMELVVLPCHRQRNRLHGASGEIQRLAVHIAVAGNQRGDSRSVRRDFDLSGHQPGHGRAVGGYGQRSDVSVD